MSWCNEPPKIDLEKLTDRLIREGNAEDLRHLAEIILARHLENGAPYSDEELGILEYFANFEDARKRTETAAGVYIEGKRAKHTRVNDLFLERAAPGQELPDKDIVSVRTYKKWDTPYTQPEEMQNAGLQPKGDGAHFTHVNTVDAPVNYICESGHQLLIGNKNAAKHCSMSLRSFERWNPPGVQVGQNTIYNITSLDWQRKKDGK